MPNASNVVDLNSVRRNSHQDLVDAIGAKAYLLLRNEAEKHQLNLPEVIAEHILGLSLVMSAVEGPETVINTLQSITGQIKQEA